MTAFEALVVQSTPSVYRLARAFAGEDAAPDVVQDVFIAAWRELPRLRDPERFVPWLHRIAVNRARTAMRARGRVRELSLDDRGDPPGPDFHGPVEARVLVGPLFAALGEDHRTVLALHYAARLSHREIGEVLGIPEGTVKSRLNAALVTLRRRIGAVEW